MKLFGVISFAYIGSPPISLMELSPKIVKAKLSRKGERKIYIKVFGFNLKVH